jgi:hypothetical protein
LLLPPAATGFTIVLACSLKSVGNTTSTPVASSAVLVSAVAVTTNCTGPEYAPRSSVYAPVSSVSWLVNAVMDTTPAASIAYAVTRAFFSGPLDATPFRLVPADACTSSASVLPPHAVNK